MNFFPLKTVFFAGFKIYFRANALTFYLVRSEINISFLAQNVHKLSCEVLILMVYRYDDRLRVYE